MSSNDHKTGRPGRTSPWELAVGPPPEKWDDWVELDASAWPEKRERHFRCIPTICFNCESACGLLAFVDRETGETVKFEGNPVHPGSRGRTCAKGPATLNQIRDPERILRPLKRTGPRGSGEFTETTWDEALDEIGGRIRRALDEGRHDEVMYHVGRPGDDHFVERMLSAWGVDGLNTHTNVCSASSRLGYSMWCGVDRLSPDFAETRFILLLSAHLETGHYFNPHAQRIIDAKSRGARVGVVDTRLSNTTSHADLWISPWPGSEAALLLGVAADLISSERIDKDFLRRWTNWPDFLSAMDPEGPGTFDRFLEVLGRLYSRFTPEFVAEECRIPVDSVIMLSEEIARAGGKVSSHMWRNASSGNLGGWQIARCLMLLHVLTGSVGTPGGINLSSWDKFVPKPTQMPPPFDRWNESMWPREYPLSHYTMGYLLPHILREKDRRLDVYFTRVHNPVWTNPDGTSWIEMLEDESGVGCHVAITPTWNESAQWADWVLPMGHGPERHDLMSQETHAGSWIGFRQAVSLQFRRLEGEDHDTTLGTNPGDVWEESEFWIALTWKIDPDGSRGIRRFFESSRKPGEPVSLDEYYADIFDNAVPGLPEAAGAEGLDPLAYMRKYGAYEVPYGGQRRYEKPAAAGETGVDIDGARCAGFKTPSRRLEIYSRTLAEWGWQDQAVPGYIRSHIHWREIDEKAGEMVLLPTFRLPTLVHTRTANAKWLQEISHTNPLWVHPEDAERRGIDSGDLVRVTTRIGHFVLRAWVTEGIHPGIVACSHHVGRWRMHRDAGGHRISSSLVKLSRENGIVTFRQREGVGPFDSDDPDTRRVWWSEVGVNQNLTFPVQPDPVSGMHCWHQKVTVDPARQEDRYGDILVDTAKAREAWEEWRLRVRPAPGPGGLRRPLWLKRPMRPVDDAFRL